MVVRVGHHGARSGGMCVHRRAIAGVAALGVVVPSAILGSMMLVTHGYGRRAVRGRKVAQAAGGTVVVFGGRALADRPGRVLQARLDHALSLYRAGRVAHIAVAGGVPAITDHVSGGYDEVAAGTTYLRRAGVPDAHVIGVSPGQNTREQVESTRHIVVDSGRGPVVAVSSSYHLLRISIEARRMGFRVVPSAPAASPDTATARLYLSHLVADSIALLWYASPRWLTSHIYTGAGSFRHMALLSATGDISWRELPGTLHPRTLLHRKH